jgi:hypothetical protein
MICFLDDLRAGISLNFKNLVVVVFHGQGGKGKGRGCSNKKLFSEEKSVQSLSLSLSEIAS